jgi:hypothetical protein
MISPRILSTTALSLALGAAALSAAPAAHAAEVDCKLTFEMSGWSVFYKTASGHGTVTCDNGQSMRVKVSTKGGGITFGKSKIENGTGEFSGIHDISEVLGTYVTAEAHAGAVKSSKAQVMTKGEVSLALAGTGRGWDVGIAFGKFVIERR